LRQSQKKFYSSLRSDRNVDRTSRATLQFRKIRMLSFALGKPVDRLKRPEMSSFAVILAAAGKSTRFKDQHYKKPFARLDDRAVWLHSVDKFLNREDVKQLIVAIAPDQKQNFMEQFGPNVAIMGIEVVEGGEERSDTVRRALAIVKDEIDFVVIHDAARPCLAPMWIDELFQEAKKSGAAILAAPVTSTLKRATGSGANLSIAETVDRNQLWAAQTPQVFKKELLVDAFAQIGQSKPTDEAQLLELAGHPVSIVPCSEMNIKITTREDLKLAKAILKLLPQPKLDAPPHPFTDDHLWR